MKLIFYLTIFTPAALGFQCYQCNNGINEDDTKPCVDQKMECPNGTKSCSTIFYKFDQNNQIHIRKFCTNPSTYISQYFHLLPNNSVCQNILTNQDDIQFTSMLKRRRREALPPAPPRKYKNNIECICAKSLCNNGIRKEIIDRIILDPSRSNIDISLQQLIP